MTEVDAATQAARDFINVWMNENDDSVAWLKSWIGESMADAINAAAKWRADQYEG